MFSFYIYIGDRFIPHYLFRGDVYIYFVFAVCVFVAKTRTGLTGLKAFERTDSKNGVKLENVSTYWEKPEKRCVFMERETKKPS